MTQISNFADSNLRVRMHHAHLFASDLSRSIEFYTRYFGAEVLMDGDAFGARNVMMKIGDGRLNFYDKPPRGTAPNAIHHLGFQTDDLEALVAVLKADGATVTSTIKGDPGGRYIMIEAPDNVLLEVFEVDSNLVPGPGGEWFAW